MLGFIVTILFYVGIMVLSYYLADKRRHEGTKHLHYEDRQGKFIQDDPHDAEGYDCNKDEEEIDPITRYK